MKKKNYVGKAVMLGALLAPIGLPTVSVLARWLLSKSNKCSRCRYYKLDCQHTATNYK